MPDGRAGLPDRKPAEQLDVETTGMARLGIDWRETDLLFDFCVVGTPWRKATRIRTNGQLGKHDPTVTNIQCSGEE